MGFKDYRRELNCKIGIKRKSVQYMFKIYGSVQA